MQVIAPDPNFSRLIHGVLIVVGAVIGQLVALSHYVVCVRLQVLILERDDDIAFARKADAAWKSFSAMWKGVDSAITRFCVETELTREQVLVPEPPPLVEEAREHLHPDSRVDRATETAVLRTLRRAWEGTPAFEAQEPH